MTLATTALVVENDPTDDVRRLGDWLVAAGLELTVVRPHLGEEVPEDPDGLLALVVMGGFQSAADGVGDGGRSAADDVPGAPWFDRLERLLRRAVKAEVPTLGVCLGGQLLARAMGGRVAPAEAGPEFGPRLVARRDAAERDPLFREVPFLPDVLQWHHDEIVELPPGATLLAASPNYPHQAFRVGHKAWGLQFHIESDTAMIASWAAEDAEVLAELGYDPAALVEACDAVMDDVEEVWQPFAERFAGLATGQLASRRQLPVLE